MLKRLILIFALLAGPVWAQDKTFVLQVPPALEQTGFMKHLLPRFSLKTGVRITSGTEPSDAAFGEAGTPVFTQGELIWHFSKTDGPHTDAFQDWLLSEVGKRTIDAFAPDGTQLFSSDVSVEEVVEVVALEGDAVLGEKMAMLHCGRCHVVNESNRMNAIGSSPSFALMRTFEDWEQRFAAFFVLKPHPAFTQIAEITEPFPENLPSPIAPIELTLEEVEAITAYVGSLEPADLGAPLQTQ